MILDIDYDQFKPSVRKRNRFIVLELGFPKKIIFTLSCFFSDGFANSFS